MARLKCSFCGRSEDQVAKLVAGTGGRGSSPSVYICDQCVEKAKSIMADAAPAGGESRPDLAERDET